MIRDFLKKFDIYAHPINFTIKGSPLYKTSVGGSFTILILTLFIFLIFNFSYDSIYKLNPALFFQTIIEVDKHFIDMNNTFTNIILQPNRKDNQNEFRLPSSLFYIKVENATYTKYENGRKDNNFTEVGLKRCNISDFHESLHEYYKINNFDRSFCVNKDYSIKGAYSSNIFKFLRIWVKDCIGKDNLTGEKINCINKSEVVKEVSNWKLSLYLTYAIANPSNYTHPFQTQIFNKGLIFYPATDTRENYFLSRDIISTDDDLFPTSNEYNRSISNYVGQDTSVSYNNLESPTDEWSYFRLYIRTHTSYTLLKRTYKKLPEILAGTISILEIFHISLTIIYPLYNDLPLKLDIINSTFHNVSHDEVLLRKLIINIISSTVNSYESNKNVDSNNIKTTRTVISKQSSTGLLHLKMNPSFKQNKTNTIKTESLIWNKITCKKTKDVRVYDHFDKIVNNRLEFRKYLEIYEEIDRIKDLILDSNQKIVFNYWLRKYKIDDNDNIVSNWLKETKVSNQEILNAVNTINSRFDKTKIDYSILNSLN